MGWCLYDRGLMKELIITKETLGLSPEAYLEASRTSTMKDLLDALLGSKYDSYVCPVEQIPVQY